MPPPVMRQCVFRGQVFGVDYVEDAGARRNQVDSLPDKDLPASDDFGPEPVTFTFEAFLVGDDFQERARLLVAACRDRKTPGLLSTPDGSSVVRCTGCVRRMDKSELRMARFRLSFVQVDRLPTPTRRASPTAAVERAATAATAASSSTLSDNLAVSGVPNDAIRAASSEVEKVGDSLSTLTRVREAVSQASALSRKAASFIRDAQSLVLEPIRLAQELSDAVELVAGTAGDALSSLYAYRTLEALRPNPYSSGLLDTNAGLVIQAVRVAALAGWARAAARVPWATFEDAIAQRLAIEDAIDDLAGISSYLVYPTLQDLRAAVGLAVPPPDANIPRIRELTLPNSLPAIMLAYRLYDDTRRAEEITLRNRAKHPSFLPSGVPLQVLANA